ncbi:MAG: hypothetical protein COB38_00115 [Gammaproteobacteria bacterium]|nr:MAG: hypothetical protein COB38_00115 [Gammaproteobacteria bacterium]
MNRVKGLLIISGLFLSFSLFAVDQVDIAGFETDSCTTPVLGSSTQWSGWGGVCRVHDWHYRRFGVQRTWADATFRDNLKKRCKNKYRWYDPRRNLCRATANAWYTILAAIPNSTYYNRRQNNTISNVTTWVNDNSNTTKTITTTAVEPDFRYPDEPFYIHLLSKKYVDLLEKASIARLANTTHIEKWNLLVNAFSKGKDDFTGWEADVLTLWNLKECWDGSFADNNQECPVWTPPDNPCFDLRSIDTPDVDICRDVEMQGNGG